MKRPKEKIEEMERAIHDLEEERKQYVEKIRREQERWQAHFSFLATCSSFSRYRHQKQELKSFSEATIHLKGDLKIVNQKLQGLKHSRNNVEQDIKILEEQIGHLEKDEETQEQTELERRTKIQPLDERKSTLSIALQNSKLREVYLEQKQHENCQELEKQRKSRQDHKLKKDKIEANINKIKSAGKTRQLLSVFDPMAPKIAERIEEAARYSPIDGKQNCYL